MLENNIEYKKLEQSASQRFADIKAELIKRHGADEYTYDDYIKVMDKVNQSYPDVVNWYSNMNWFVGS